MTQNWRAINLANWESRVPVHTGPGGYDRTSFDDPAHLSNVVRYDLPRLGQLDGLDVVHLQCHVGTDTISLARLGARTTVGVDFSPSALREARNLAARTDAAVTFIDGDAYDAVELLGAERFDLVYTGIGAICWLPSIRRWPTSSRGCCGRVDACSCVRVTRCSGRYATRDRMGCSWSSTRTLRPKACCSARKRPTPVLAS